MNDNVLVVGEIEDLLGRYVIAELYTDRKFGRAKEADARNLKLQTERFREGALPLYLALSADGVELARWVGLATTAEFADFLRKGLDSPH